MYLFPVLSLPRTSMQAIWTLKQLTLIDFKPLLSIAPSKKECYTPLVTHLNPWSRFQSRSSWEFRIEQKWFLLSVGLKRNIYGLYIEVYSTISIYIYIYVCISCIWSKTYCCYSACNLCFRTLPALWPTVLSKMADEFLVAKVVHIPATTKAQ